ncbi:MAG: sulfotransferase [Hyphomonadaceae bacterium]
MSAALLQAAQAALARRDFAGAKQAAEQVLRDRPSDAGANQILGLIALEQGDATTAKTFLQRADKASPGQAHILNALGVALRRTGDLPEARRAFSRAGERGLIDGWRNLGNLEALAGDAAATAKSYERALTLNASDVASLAGLAQAKELLHDLAAARAHAVAALAIDANNEIAMLTLAQIAARERKWGEAEAAAGRVARGGRSPTNKALAWGVIGDVRDKQDDAASAFAAFSEANRILLSRYAAHLTETQMPYHLDGVERMKAFVAAADVSSWAGSSGTPSPIFLVGFPRSGTTLLEQVLSAHSKLACIEEREHLALAAGEVAADPSKLTSLTDEQVGVIREDYWRRVRGEANIGGSLVVDKLPLNIIFLPLIRRVFPNAKILFALRDPRDVVLSCFQQRFGMNAAMVQFLELNLAAAYYDKVMSLALLCRERLGLDVLEVRYEDVVADLQEVARSVTSFLDLPFEEAMLSPAETARKRNINTPSARQVVEPIYTRSVARWKKYEAQLSSVLPILNRWAERLGY